MSHNIDRICALAEVRWRLQADEDGDHSYAVVLRGLAAFARDGDVAAIALDVANALYERSPSRLRALAMLDEVITDLLPQPNQSEAKVPQ